MKPQHLALMLLICAVWGGNFVVSKLAINHFPPVLFTALRFAMVGLLMAPWLRWAPGQMRNVVIAALCMGTLHFVLIILGIAKADDVAVVAVVTQLGIPIVTLMAVVMLGERIRWKRALGIGMAFFGAVVISFDPKVMNYQVAIGMILVAVVIMSYGQIVVRRIRDVHTFTMQAWVGLLSAPSLLLISLAMESNHMQRLETANAWHWSAVVYAAVFVSLIGHGGTYYLLRRYPISIVNPGFTLSPIFGVLAGMLLLGEQLSNRVIAGMVITLVGVLIVALREGRVADSRGVSPEKAALETTNKAAGE